MDNLLRLVKELTNEFGAPGFEDNVLEVIKKNTGFTSSTRDNMNNLYLGLDKVDSSKPTVALDCHSDEVGFMVESISQNGGLKIIQLGGWHIGNIPSSAVLIKNNRGELIKGIVASKPPHFMSEAERNQVPKMSDLTVDIGTSSYEETVNVYGIEIGAPIVPDVEFVYDDKISVIRAKAIDNRVGCALTVEVMDRLKDKMSDLNVNVVGVVSSQEEVGLRGATVSAEKVKPDFAIIFESSPADDTFKNQTEAQGKLKGGLQLRIKDGNMISNPRVIKYAIDVAKRHNIKYQVTVREKGGTNAGKYHLSGEGIPTLVICAPSRYIHTSYSYAAYEDIKAAAELAIAIINEITMDDINKF